MRILITGITGFAGGWLAQELARVYPSARLFGMSHSDAPFNLTPDAVVRPADLNDRASLELLVSEAEPDIVFHLAGYASGAGTDRESIFRVNVEGTLLLLDVLAARDRPCRVLLASSGYVYGATQPGRPAREEDTLAPSGPYAESKAAMEQAAHALSGISPLQMTVARSFNHTGPRQTTAFVLPAFAEQIARIEAGLEPAVLRHGNLEALRDFLDVRDVVEAYRLLVCETEPAAWRVVNVASGNTYRIRDLLHQLTELSRVPITLEQDPARLRPSDLAECIGDPALLTRLTGWRPRVPMEQTLRATLDWWRANVVS